MASSSHSTLPTAATFHVPIEITIDILSRLPVKSLLRFKSVCKNWYALIQSPDFISKHLTTHPNPNSNLSFSSLLVTTYNRETNYYGMSLHYLDKYGFLDGPINLDFPFLNGRDSLLVVGVCDGLVCLSLSRFEYALIICNPATRKFREIPDCEWQDGFLSLVEHGWSVHFKQVSFGFGYDPNANDYKLIRILYYECPQELVVRADVYAMGTGTWREMDGSKLYVFYGDTDDVLLIDGTSASTVLKGVFYWGPCVSAMNEGFLVSLDMGDEVFRKIRTPQSSDEVWDENNWQVMQMKDKLALSVFHPDDRCFDVWMLNENQMSWTNQFIVGPFPGIESPVGCGENGEITVVGFGKNGELIVRDNKESGDMKLFLYDQKSRETKNLCFGQVPYRSFMCLYTETLLPVKENNELVFNKKKKIKVKH